MKNIPGHKISHEGLLTFSMLFPEEAKMHISMYLHGLNRRDVLRAATLLVGVNKTQTQSNRTFLQNWMTESNKNFFNNLIANIEYIEEFTPIPIIILNPISSLRIFEYAFSNLQDYNISDDALEIRLIKAYLVLNEEIEELEKTCIESIGDVDKNLKYSWYLFCYHYFSHEFTHYFLSESVAIQLIKSVYLFELLSSRSDVKWLLDSFLEYYNHTNWETYLKEYLPITKSILDKPSGHYLEIVVSQGEKFLLGCNFLDRFTMGDEEVLDEYDFKSLRATPLYKLEKGKYLVVYDLFAIEKIFLGTYFKLQDIYTCSDESKQTLGSFKGFYGREFSENYLLYRTISSCFPKRYIHISGAQSKKKGMSSREPDYYVRNKNKVFLFENKDTLIAAPIKQSCDYNLIEPELKKRFYFSEAEGKIKNGAVLQLMHNIKLILTSKFIPDNEVKAYTSIYPILVVHYNQYNTPGLNQIVNQWFQVELNNLKEDGIDVRNIYPLTIIDIDTLIILQDYLISRQIVLEDVIKQYAENLRSPFYALPFSNLITNLAINKGFNKPPAILIKCGLALYK